MLAFSFMPTRVALRTRPRPEQGMRATKEGGRFPKNAKREKDWILR